MDVTKKEIGARRTRNGKRKTENGKRENKK